jgi:hypothetical protein
MSIKQNITSLQSLLEQVNALPNTENLDNEIQTQSTLLSEQDAKIAELAEVLANKAGGGSASYDTCTVDISTDGTIYKIAYLTVDDNGVIDFRFETTPFYTKTITCICGSYITLQLNNHVSSNCTNADITGFLARPIDRIYHITASKNETASIYIDVESGGSDV